MGKLRKISFALLVVSFGLGIFNLLFGQIEAIMTPLVALVSVMYFELFYLEEQKTDLINGVLSLITCVFYYLSINK